MPQHASIFAHGAVLVPDFVTPAEEERILLRISQAPLLTELRRRVQHYGYRYDYAGSAVTGARTGAARSRISATHPHPLDRPSVPA